MAYAKWVKKGGNVYGPYFYETIVDEDGKRTSVYLGTEPPRQEPEPDPCAVTPDGEIRPAHISAAGIVVILVLLFGYLSFTGYLTGITTLHTLEPDEVFTESGEYSFEMEVPGNLSSLSLSGVIVGNGSVRVYLMKSGEKLPVLDSEDLDAPNLPEENLSFSGDLPITGMIINETPSQEPPVPESQTSLEQAHEPSQTTSLPEPPSDTTPPEPPDVNETQAEIFV
ncbi:MAG: hypothetical protein KAT35_04690, partial [Candidatus Aenigmarchaeota archaeon]|nr:hypothetical protein [Candidatus Aenigmarchaeota archaeon]